MRRKDERRNRICKETGTLADQTKVLVAGKHSVRERAHRMGLQGEPLDG